MNHAGFATRMAILTLLAAHPFLPATAGDNVERLSLAELRSENKANIGEMIATVKIIPFALSTSSHNAALQVANRSFVRVAPYKIGKVGIISTVLPGLSAKVIDKMAAAAKAARSERRTRIVPPPCDSWPPPESRSSRRPEPRGRRCPSLSTRSQAGRLRAKLVLRRCGFLTLDSA